MSERSQFGLPYAGLIGMPSVRFASAASKLPLLCPMCGDESPIHLTGKISFSASMSNEDLFEGRPQPLAAFVCLNSHVFFLREEDFVVESSQVVS
jgi:hypothetical protein